MRKDLFMIAIVLIALLPGCTPLPRDTAQVAVLPESEIVSLNTSIDAEASTRQRWERFINYHGKGLVNKQIYLYSNQSTSKKWIRQVYRDLGALGVDRSHIQHLTLPTTHSYGFDLQIQLTQHRVVTRPCRATAVTDVRHFRSNACYVNNARWHSMITPQTLLLPNGMRQNVQPLE